MSSPFHKPPTETPSEAWVDVFKEQVLLMTLDEDSETITAASIVRSPGGSEVTDLFDGEGTAICPCDGSRLHVAGGIEGRIELYIFALMKMKLLFKITSTHRMPFSARSCRRGA